MRPARIYLVRHGETRWNAEGRCQGTADSEFSERGLLDLAALTASLADVEFDAAYTSPLRRAVRTAEHVLASRGLRAATVPELAELSYGSLQGMPFEEWPGDLDRAWRSDPWSVTFPAGESLAMVRDRVIPVFRAIVGAHVGETALVSAHGHVNRLILLEALDRPATDFWKMEQRNGSTTVIDCSVGAIV